MTTSHIAAVALGSNLGDRSAFIEAGFQALDTLPFSHVVSRSSIFESPALTKSQVENAPDYLNAVALVSTSLPAEDLLRWCLQIESDNGRVRSTSSRWLSRTLDLDILTYGDLSLQTENLTIPHTRLAERRFVLEPFAEIAPDLRIPPPFDATVQYLLSRCPESAPLTIVSSRTVNPPHE